MVGIDEGQPARELLLDRPQIQQGVFIQCMHAALGLALGADIAVASGNTFQPVQGRCAGQQRRQFPRDHPRIQLPFVAAQRELAAAAVGGIQSGGEMLRAMRLESEPGDGDFAFQRQVMVQRQRQSDQPDGRQREGEREQTAQPVAGA